MTADVLIMAAPVDMTAASSAPNTSPVMPGGRMSRIRLVKARSGFTSGWIAMDARPMAAVVAMKKIQCTPKMSRPFLLSLADLVEA